jgi:hypothetical protein
MSEHMLTVAPPPKIKRLRPVPGVMYDVFKFVAHFLCVAAAAAAVCDQLLEEVD